jgi:hypothetical protein
VHDPGWQLAIIGIILAFRSQGQPGVTITVNQVMQVVQRQSPREEAKPVHRAPKPGGKPSS